MQKALAERLQPPNDVSGKGRGARDEGDAVNTESRPLQGSDKCRDDRMDADIAAAFGHKPPIWPESSIHRGQHRIGALDPMKNRVAEYGIELLSE